MPKGWMEEYDIQVIPINIHFGEQMFLQGVDLSNSDFYRMADESGEIPKTSQPTPQQFSIFYRKIAQPGIRFYPCMSPASFGYVLIRGDGLT